MRLAFCISGGGQVAAAVLAARREGVLAFHDPVAVLARQSPFSTLAAGYGVTVEMVDRTNFSDRESFRAALSAKLLTLDVDALFLTFDWLLPDNVLEHFGEKIVNLHMALLPLFPGRGAIAAAASSSLAFAGVTYHRVDHRTDAGPVIAQAVTPIPFAASPEILGHALFRKAAPLGVQVVRWLSEGRLGQTKNGRVEVAGAQFDSPTFSPALDPDVARFADEYLKRRFTGHDSVG